MSVELVKQHAEWVAGRAAKPDLRVADLSRANLSRADLSWADLRGADLRGADLSGANLRGANLSRADLREATLSRADLSRAHLSWADLSRATLRGANLSRADLREAIGFHVLTYTSHGYRIDASWQEIEWRILAGCRNYSTAEARAHWGATDYHTPSSGMKVVAMLDWLEQQPTPDKARESGGEGERWD